MGWALILLIFAVLSFYTGLLLRRCLDSQPGLETYPDIGQAAFGTGGRIAISIVLYVELYACCIEYIILESDNLSSLFPNAHLSLGGYMLDSHILFAILTTLAVLPTYGFETSVFLATSQLVELLHRSWWSFACFGLV
ncbi:vacuolar amino acid transporter 1 [Prunus yedoensis var. nudiflora]|uniref:Vacuolar amino acid transporter 1 n=1 Tax=Prunus yedoensis var. nudiflora TaxID=2094558 RepID=A0A314YAF4_PRUYE|nr:vacuolar amino acid transporter 1 [Prunus yedoensis var. nudiflora]